MKKIFFGLMSLFMLGLVGCAGNNSTSTNTESTGSTNTESTGSTNTESTDNYKMTIASPGGAPAIAMSTLLVEHGDDYEYTLGLEPAALGPLFQKKEKDIIFAPINMGAKMFKNNSSYQLGAVVTWGNLYIASQKPDFKFEDLNNMPLTIFPQSGINGVVVRHILEKKNITPTAIKDLGDAKATQQQLIKDKEGKEAYLVAEPSLTVAKLQNPNITSISVQDLYKEVSGNKEFAQAAVFINVNTIKNHKSVVDKFLTRLNESCEVTKTNPAKAAENAVSLEVFAKKEPLIKAMPNCNIKYVSALNSKESIEGLVELSPSDFGGAKPVDAFYYEG